MKLVFSKSSAITVATNTFINVPVIVQYDDTPLIEVVNQQALEFTTQLSVFHPDGTYLAKVKGNRVFPTEEGKKSKIDVITESSKFVCTLEGNPIFELSHQTGEKFKADAELYTPTGYFVKFDDRPQPTIINTSKESIKVGGVIMSGNIFQNLSIGVLIKSNGSMLIGVS